MTKPVGLNLSFRREKNKLSIAKGHDTNKFLFYLFISFIKMQFWHASNEAILKYKWSKSRINCFRLNSLFRANFNSSNRKRIFILVLHFTQTLYGLSCCCLQNICLHSKNKLQYPDNIQLC
jgi:hypothetical protein